MKIRSLRPLAPFIVAAIATSTAQAQSTQADGIYRRLSGDLGLQLEVGGAVSGGDGAALARSTLRYLQTAGVYATYLDNFRTTLGPNSRSASLGIELRPLFLPRAGLDMQRGPSLLDLFVDSFALRFGAVIGRQAGFELSAPGLEVAIALGLPLTRSAPGPWLDASAGMRVSDRQLCRQDPLALDRAALFTLTLGWQVLVASHLVDAGDGLRR